jgi:gas vesicle protein
MKMVKILILLAAIGATTGLVLSPSRPPVAQEAEEDEDSSSGVKETEVELYIAVYKAMQANHQLTIEEALKPHNTSLEQFRSIERRVQKQQRLVDRVREELVAASRQDAGEAAGRASTPKDGKTEEKKAPPRKP